MPEQAPRQPSAVGSPPRLAWLLAYAVATFLAFPHPLGDRVVDLGWLLAWVGPGCLLLGLHGLPPRRAALWGFAAAFAAHAAILHWLWIVTVVYGRAHPLVGIAGPVGLGAYIAAFTAAFAGLFAVFRRLASARAPGTAGHDHLELLAPFVAAALWTALDHFRSFALTGFPWATLGYAQHANPALLGLAPYTGVYGLSFVSVLGSASLAQLVLARRDGLRSARAAWAGLSGVLVACVAGMALWLATPPDPAATLRVAVLQGNIDQGVKWSPEWYERTLATYEELAREATAAGARVIVWPETAVAGGIGGANDPSARLAALARETGVEHVMGAVGLEWPAEGEPPRIFDSAFLVDAGGAFRDRYDKSHLVPWGEYVPFQDWLGQFYQAVARGMASSSVSPGSGPRAVSLAVSGRPALTAGVPICYELIFPDVVRRFVDDGAEMLFAITNDAWYGRTGAPYQFLAITALRSAETRVWTARAANTGVSAIIDARGRVRKQTRIFERGWLVADVPRRSAPVGGSFYTRFGDVFAWTCWLVVAGIWIGARGAKRRGAAA